MRTNDDLCDIVIIGAGPVGLYAAYYAGFRNLKTILLDALPEAGGQITAMYPEKDIRDVAGFASVRGAELVDNLLEQASQYELDLRLGVAVTDILDAGDECYDLFTSEGGIIRSRAVLISAGLGKFEPRPLPTAPSPLPNGVLHFVPKLSVLEKQNVVIVGGGDSAVDWALAAHKLAKSVTVVHRRPHFRAHEASVEEMKQSGARVIAPAVVEELRGAESIESVLISQAENKPEEIPCDRLILALGFTASLGPLEKWGLERCGHHIGVGPDMQTSKDRIFAAGDITEYPGKVRLISVGFGEAAIAVNHIAAVLFPDQNLFPGHSTHESL